MNRETDMRAVIRPKSDQLNADDLIAGPLIIRITEARVNPDAREQPVTIRFEGDQGRPWKPCKGMSRLLVQLWGPDSATYTGKRLALYRDPDVKWAGEAVGGIRISHADDIDRETPFTVTLSKAQRKRITLKPMRDAPDPRDFEPVHGRADAPADPVAEVRGLITRVTGQKTYATTKARLDALAMDMEHSDWQMLADELEIKKQALIAAAERTQDHEDHDEQGDGQ